VVNLHQLGSRVRSTIALVALALCAFVALSAAMKRVAPSDGMANAAKGEAATHQITPGRIDSLPALQPTDFTTGSYGAPSSPGTFVKPGDRRPGRFASSADSIVKYSVHKFTHSGPNSSYTDFDDTFTPDTVAGWRYVLEVVNGGCSHVWVGVAGQEVIGTNDISSRVLRTVDVYPTPGQSNDIWVTLQGNGSCYISMRIVRVHDETFTLLAPTTHTGPSPGGGYVDTFTQVAGDSTATLRVVNGDGSGFNRVTGATLKLNGVQVLGTSDFSTGVAIMERQVNLAKPMGLNTVTLTGEPSGKQLTVRVRVPDVTPPVLNLNYPMVADTFVTDSTSLMISGSVTDETPGLVNVSTGSNQAAPGTFGTTVSMTSDGLYDEPIHGINSALLSTTKHAFILRDRTPPTVATTFPVADTALISTSNAFTLTGHIADMSKTV
ncbi:MAG: hypothetical protein ACRDL7_07485, partial [Gaiellaceae bacterium]